MRVGFTGTRYGLSAAQMEAVQRLLHGGIGEFHHGDCVGADFEAASMAKLAGYRIIGHPPRNQSMRAFFQSDDERAPQSYRFRNRRIVFECEYLIAAPREASECVRGGTWSTWRLSKAFGRKTVLVLPNGKVSHG